MVSHKELKEHQEISRTHPRATKRVMVANMPLACGILQFGEPSFAGLRFELIWRKDLLSQQSITLRSLLALSCARIVYLADHCGR